MPDYDPQVSRQRGEDAIRSQVQQDLEQRFGPPPPANKTLFETGMQGAAEMKEGVGTDAYLGMLTSIQEKMVELSRIQRKESENYITSLRKIENLKGKELKHEMDQFNLMKNRKQVVKDLNDLQEKGFEGLRREQQVRVKQYQSDIAEARAMTQAGVDPSIITAHGIRQTPADLIAQGRGNLFARMATKRGIRGYLGRQALESGAAVAGEGFSVKAIPALLRANPLVAGVVGAGYALRGLNEGRGIYVPGVGSVPFSDWQTQLAAGQVTGEGYGAGLAARGEAIRMGLNPFDQISMQVANAIVSAVRGQGFRGAMAREFENSIKDIYKDTGLPVEQIAEMGRLYARGGNLDNFRSQMQSLDDIAKNTSNSVNTVAETFKSFTDTLVGQGGQRNIPLVPAMTRLVANLTGPGGAFAGQFTQFFQQAGQYAGLTPTAAATPAGQRQTRQALMTFLPQMRNQLSGLDDQTLGLMIDSGAFPGITNVDALRTLLEKGPGQISQVGSLVRQSQMRSFFDQAELRRRSVHHDPNLLGKALHVAGILTPGIAVPWGGSDHQDRTPEREAYVRSLTRSLEGTKLTTAQREEILRPLRRSARGADVDFQGRHLDWDQTVRLARTRADRFTERAQRGDTSLTIRLDPAETRRLLGGKNVSKSVQLEHAAEGAARYVGTAFADNLP